MFDPFEFNFGVGDTITFTLTGESEFHTFTIDELGIDESVEVDEPVTFSVTFDRPGAFQLICIPHELQGMTGTITVQ